MIGIAKGVTLEVDTTTVGQITSLGGPNQSAETVDVTTLTSVSNYAEFLGGAKDGGEVSVEGFFDGDDEGQSAIMDAYASGVATACVINFPSAMKRKCTFNAVVTAVECGFTVNEVIPFRSTLKISGAPTLVHTTTPPTP